MLDMGGCYGDWWVWWIFSCLSALSSALLTGQSESMRTRPPPEEPAVQLLDITLDGETSGTGSQPRAAPRWLVVAVVAALVAGLGYGFVLGRGDRPTDDDDEQTGSTTSTTALTATTVNVGSLETNRVGFRRSQPGHDLGRGVTEFLNPNRFSTIAVDTSGLVWAGGPAGVVRLNPATGEFDRLTDSDGTGPLDVHGLAAGPDGSAYAATGRGLSHWDGIDWALDTVLVQEMSEWGLLMPEVGPLAVASDGTVWLVTHEWSGWAARSYVHHGSAPFYPDVPTTEFGGFIHELAVGPDGAIWALADDALWRYDGEWLKTSLEGWVSAMAVDTEGDVWVGRDGEIIHFGGENGATTTAISWGEALGLDDTAEPLEGLTRLMAAGPDGSVWALAEVWEPGPDWPAEYEESRDTLIRIEEGAVSLVTLPEAPSDTRVEDVAVAPNGDPWIAFDGRLMHFDGTGWSEFFIGDQPPLGDVGSMTVGPAGDLWLAGDARVTRLTSDGWRVFDRAELSTEGNGDPGLDGDLWVDSAGERVWVGIGCRVFEYGATRWEPLPPLPDEPVDCWGASTAALSDGSVWLAVIHPYGGTTYVHRWADDEWATLGRAELQASGMDIGPDGTVWLAGWGGLGRFEDGGWSPLVTGQGFEHVAIDSDGAVWASASDWGGSSGVWRFLDGVWEIEQQEPFESTTVALTHHPDGSVWTLERDSDGGFDAHGSKGRDRFIVDTGELHTMAIGPDGAIWVGGEGRLYRVAPPGELDLTPVEWGIQVDERGPGTHTVAMIVEVGTLAQERVADTSGRLVWNETRVELCGIRIRSAEDGFLVIGDIFQTTEGCGSKPAAMQDAFDEFGLPDEGCVFIDVNGHDQPLSYCGPLSTDHLATP
jgi:hypothetical protein